MEVDRGKSWQTGPSKAKPGRAPGEGVEVRVLTPPGDCRRSDRGCAPRTQLWPAQSRGGGGMRACTRSHVGQFTQAHKSMCAPTHRISRFIHSFMLCIFID